MKRANKQLIKKINTASILNVIRKEGPVSRAYIAKKLELTPATISSNVQNLLNEKLVIEIGDGVSTGGRKPILLKFNGEELFAAVVDVGINKVKIGLMNFNGEIIQKTVCKYEKLSIDNVLETIKINLEKIFIKFNDKIITGIGIGMHGIVDSKKGTVLYSPGFNCKNITIKEYFEEEFKINTYVDNDVRAMAYGERWFGNCKKAENFIFVNLAVGIGSALFIDGKMYEGYNSGAGEIGHVKVSGNNLKCRCGSYGCLETVASTTAIVEHFINSHPNSKILCDYSKDQVTTELMYKYAQKGNEECIKTFGKAGGYIGEVLASVINILNPEKIIIAGGLAKAEDYILKPIRDSIKCNAMHDNVINLNVITSKNILNAGLIGAGTLVLKDIFKV